MDYISDILEFLSKQAFYRTFIQHCHKCRKRLALEWRLITGCKTSSGAVKKAWHESLMLEVLTDRVPAEFLACLDELGIPYLFAGKSEFEPALFL